MRDGETPGIQGRVLGECRTRGTAWRQDDPEDRRLALGSPGSGEYAEAPGC